MPSQASSQMVRQRRAVRRVRVPEPFSELGTNLRTGQTAMWEKQSQLIVHQLKELTPTAYRGVLPLARGAVAALDADRRSPRLQS
jgi:hypothetical protein